MCTHRLSDEDLALLKMFTLTSDGRLYETTYRYFRPEILIALESLLNRGLIIHYGNMAVLSDEGKLRVSTEQNLRETIWHTVNARVALYPFDKPRGSFMPMIEE